MTTSLKRAGTVLLSVLLLCMFTFGASAASNGTYTLTLPIQQVSKMGVTGYLTGLTIGDVTYNGTVTGDVTKDTGVLTIKNLPASVLTGSDVNKSVLVTCNIQMDLQVLGEINTSARMCIWNQK